MSRTIRATDSNAAAAKKEAKRIRRYVRVREMHDFKRPNYYGPEMLDPEVIGALDNLYRTR